MITDRIQLLVTDVIRDMRVSILMLKLGCSSSPPFSPGREVLIR